MNFNQLLHWDPSLLGKLFPPAQSLLDWTAVIALVCAFIPASMFLVNLCFFRRPGRPWNKRRLPAISVLIPARDEELSIGAAVASVLKSRGVDLELIVLDDGSTDRTAEIVLEFAEKDPRVRLERGVPLPAGWNGKQHACWGLASRAKREVFCFLDADVRLGPQALFRMLSELNEQKEGEKDRALVSGFPRQKTETILEFLLLPLIHFVLLGFLPLPGERWSSGSGFAAGCGQFMMVRREAYFECGGHSSIPTTMHDGLLLPQVFRRYGFRTSVYDLSKDAVCRMYRGAGQVWSGLGKNATEGMASPTRIPFFTAILLAGQVMPVLLAIWSWMTQDFTALRYSLYAMALGYFIRIVSAAFYRQSWRGALLHPLGVLVLLVLQWYALLRKLAGRPATWKQRAYRVG
jgi:glycosyltransferase involved in cell wall biosynthesis